MTTWPEMFWLPPREPAGGREEAPLNDTRERIVVTGRPTSPGSQVVSKRRPSSLRMMIGPGPRAGDQVQTYSVGFVAPGSVCTAMLR
jgi:hypothetical protein